MAYGERDLLDQMSEHILERLKNIRFSYPYCQRSITKSVSTGFFRQFVVEQDGQHKDFFDLKSRALRPLIDAARVLIYHIP
ncbi:putative nucleotidyltransferase substrate binding domain-containing protein [Winogradskyella maritima]|nr:putative nucleotidyltransferase substrate binding domain-containing protein [Winogradskyella maritima]